jgi:hypothetical protein
MKVSPTFGETTLVYPAAGETAAILEKLSLLSPKMEKLLDFGPAVPDPTSTRIPVETGPP